MLDSMNLLYVTLTRAKEHLYVVSDASTFKRKEIKNIILNLLLLAMAAFVFLGRFDLF